MNVPAETPLHAYFSDRFAHQLRSLLDSRAQVREHKPIILADGSMPVPDLAIVQPLDTVYLEHHPQPNNIYWLIDYVENDTEQAMIERSAPYAAAEIQDYWIVHLKHQQLMTFCLPIAGQYQHQHCLTSGTAAPTTFLDIVIPVERLFTP
ncbi:MAG: Uma2 family endonuclease [Cyanobacteria bacterium]|nr:Uma2 family endonuclease [Cyanobacteriota bacterium]MDW8202924.1 Uma2 family endonuclease [Cyanobacteriota bacterium SKYGB_h_bin112]